jgi:hypothetical protein
MIDPARIVVEWERAVASGDEWEFWRENASEVIDVLRELASEKHREFVEQLKRGGVPIR